MINTKIYISRLNAINQFKSSTPCIHHIWWILPEKLMKNPPTIFRLCEVCGILEKTDEGTTDWRETKNGR